MYRIVLVVLLGVLAIGCDESEHASEVMPETGENIDEVRAVIEAHNANLEQWYAEGDIDKAAMVFAEDTWQMPPNAEPLVGRQAYADFWREVTGWGTWQFKLDMQDLVVSGSIAVERGKYELEFAPNDDAPIPAFEDRGNYVVYWRRDTDDEWRIVWDAPVSVVSPDEQIIEQD
jgi:ketosteroid isomerase-like protein